MIYGFRNPLFVGMAFKHEANCDGMVTIFIRIFHYRILVGNWDHALFCLMDLQCWEEEEEEEERDNFVCVCVLQSC